MIGKAYENHIPESERKKLGQFYTPQFIVEYLVEQLKLTSESQILDPACGSGAFLTHVLNRLIEETDRSPSFAIENNLYGIDINPFANQLTTMNLLLKTLNCEERPKKINILSADSLIDKKIVGEELFLSDEFGSEAKKNVRDLKKFFNSGEKIFDAIIGNPPYKCFGLKANTSMKKPYDCYLRNRWINSAVYKLSYYPLFIERSIELLRNGGVLAFILPDSFLVGYFFLNIRRYILDNCKIREIVLCRENFWDTANVGCPTLLILEKEINEVTRDKNKVKVRLANTAGHIKNKKFINNLYPQSLFKQLTRNRFELYFDITSQKLVNDMRKQSELKFKDVITGHTGVRAKGVSKKNIISNCKHDSYYSKGLHSGSEVLPFKVAYNGGWIKLDSRFICSVRGLLDMVDKPKIMVRKTGDSLIAAIDVKKLYHLDHVHSFSPIDSSICLEWICLLFNSKILNRFYHIVSMEVGRAMAQIDINQLLELPFVKPSSKVEEKAKELYNILSKSSQDTIVYKNAMKKVETLVANEYGLDEDLKNIAIQTVESKQLASVSSIQKVREKSRRKRKQVKRKRRKVN